jgi:hypothetical protein
VKLNLGCGTSRLDGFVNIDTQPGPNVDMVGDITRLTFNEPITEVISLHMIEHLTDPLAILQRLYDICVPDARATFACPYGSSDDADENPTHVRRMFLGSWGFFGQPHYWREEPYGYTADWMLETVELRFDSGTLDRYGRDPLELARVVDTYRNVVKEQVATLRCQKPPRARDRTLQAPYTVNFAEITPVSAWEGRAEVFGAVQRRPQ